MIISKSTAIWGDGADEATFHLEIVGNTPAEVEHLRTLADEVMDVEAKFENGTLKIDTSFERRVPLTVQLAEKAEADAKAAQAAKDAAKKKEEQDHAAAFEAAAQAKADEKLVEERADEIVEERSKSAKR